MTNINLPGISDYFLEVARGNVPGVSGINKFGRNPDIDTGGEEDIWGAGGTWTAPTAAQLHTVVSSSNDDSSSGTGMQAIALEGLDVNWLVTTEIVTLDGTTPVTTETEFIRVYRAYGTLFGSGETNVGDITITAADDATTSAYVLAGAGQTEMAIYTVPANKTGYLIGAGGSLLRIEGGSGNIANATVRLEARTDPDLPGAGWRSAWVGGLSLEGTSTFSAMRIPYGVLPPKTDIRVHVLSVSVNNVVATAWFDVILVDS